MFRIYKKNKNFVMWVSFVLISLVIISVLNFNNLPYANENERSGLSDQSNIEFTDTEEKDPKASTDITVGGTYTGITYTDNVWIKTSDAVIFKSCTFQANLYMADASNYWDFDVTVDLCTLNSIGIAYDFGDTLSVKNSTLTRISDDSSADDTTNIEVINCSFVGSEYYQLYIYRSSVDLKNCTLTNNAYFLYGGNTVVIEDSEFDSALGFGSDTTDVTIRNCKTTDISLPNGPITIQDTVSQNFDVEFDCSINETLELISDTPNVVLSNFFLGDPLPGEFSQIVITEANLNVSDITKEINSKLYILQWQDSELYVKNSYLAYMINGDGISGNCKVSNLQNCTLMNTWIRSNNTVISNCSIYNILDVDTNPYPFGGSNKPFKIENSNFLDVMIHVISGGVDIDNCDFKTDMGLLWLDAYEHPYDEKKDSFALINNSNPKIINLGLNTSIIAENLVDCNSISMRDTSHGTFNNVDVGFMNVLDFADATIDNCHINNRNFQSPYVQITNSIVDDMAPTLATILPFSVPADFLLNWSAQSGQNITGIIGSYRIYRAYTNIGGLSPSSTDFQQIGLILNPDPSDPANTTFYDADLDLPSSFLDKKQLYYIVEITDGGGNSGNSTILSTIYDTGQVFDVLDATVLFDDSLTTYDDILVSVFMIDADINNNGTQDCGNATLQCQFKYGSTILDQIIEPTGDSIDGIVYYFLIPQTLAATEITFLIQIEQNSYYDAQGIGSFDFNSTTKYGKIFTIKRPTIAFNPVDHPTDDKILVSKRIKLSVSAISNAQYISSIKVYYRVDGGDWESKSMSFDSEDGEYSVKLPKFDACTLEYYVKYVDIAGNAGELLGSKDDPETIEIIPDFPQTKLEVFDLGMIFIGSALVGVVFGFAYIFLDLNLKKRTTLNRSQKLKTFLDKSGKSKKAPAKKTPAKKKVERK